MTHSLPSCPGTKEVTSPTARQEKPLDYSPAREPSTRLLVLPDCAGGGAETAEVAEVAVGQAGAGPHLLSGSACRLWARAGGRREHARLPVPRAQPPRMPGTGLAWGLVQREGNSYFVLYNFV